MAKKFSLKELDRMLEEETTSPFVYKDSYLEVNGIKYPYEFKPAEPTRTYTTTVSDGTSTSTYPSYSPSIYSEEVQRVMNVNPFRLSEYKGRPIELDDEEYDE